MASKLARACAMWRSRSTYHNPRTTIHVPRLTYHDPRPTSPSRVAVAQARLSRANVIRRGRGVG